MEHAASRQWSLEKFSENFILPLTTLLIAKMPENMEILLNPMELPVGVESAWENFDWVGIRGSICWDIMQAEEVIRFDVRSLEEK